jgi:3-deoxy-D-manno-octulosonate 8-phosphate phosphatase KdsC-like HAD superfamily phosphatase
MQTIEIQTLVDITDTKVARPNQGTPLQHDQYRNFTTLRQCVEIRSIISYDASPTVETKDLKDLGFGSNFKGKHKVWTFRFYPDRSGAYIEGNNEVGTLLDDVNGVPVIQKLTETINMDTAMFELKNAATKNTIIKAIQGTN